MTPVQVLSGISDNKLHIIIQKMWLTVEQTTRPKYGHNLSMDILLNQTWTYSKLVMVSPNFGEKSKEHTGKPGSVVAMGWLAWNCLYLKSDIIIGALLYSVMFDDT